jgi:hypothetical protein
MGERSQALIEELAGAVVDCLGHHEHPAIYTQLRVSGSRWANDGRGQHRDLDAAEVVARVHADQSWMPETRRL